MPGYAELQVTTNFSFLRGGSHPEELAATAAALGHRAIAVTDRNSLAGVVRGHQAAKELGVGFVVGARLDLADGTGPEGGASLLVYPSCRAAYGRLSRLLTLGKRRAPKGQCHIARADLMAHAEGLIAAVLPPAAPASPAVPAAFARELAEWREAFAGRCHLVAHHLYRGDDGRRLAALSTLSGQTGVPLVATNDVHYHVPARRPLQDVLSCIREHCTIAEAGFRLAANAERHLKPPAEMARLFRRLPEALERGLAIAEAAAFSLDELRYEYPDEVTSEGRTPQEELAHLAWAGAHERYGPSIPARVRDQVVHELALIAQLDYAPYFLTVHDIVRFARSRGILCQGRGSAANSAVCFCLGITSVDPGRMDLLFERFISAERNEPPDIDVDFEHERREEVIQYIYGKYGRERAGIAATVIRYRARSAVREVGKAMGLSTDTVARLAGTVWGWSGEAVDEAHVRENGLDPMDRTLALALCLSRELIGFPRHLSQHVGGFVITRGPLSEVMPIGNAAMADRTHVEWDKDDLDALGILKIDVLGLGMLTCLRKGFDLIARHHGRRFELATVPPEDPAVYDMLCLADSVGVFQVESRAQMSFLPRMKPRSFYDLVIEVAIVRPGPIQGDMVHPYLRRRNGEEEVAFPSAELRQVLGKTLGVPLFQEQAMRIAVVAAGFTPGEADRLRRAMATFRKTGQIHAFRHKMVEGMLARGYERGFAERCFGQIEGFGEYGFPESHAASFALLVYASAWMKRRYPAAFACALLNAQPMGFYAPAQIVRDAREHGVPVRPVDVNESEWDCTLEPDPKARDGVALRLGLRQVKGLEEEAMRRLAAARGGGWRTVRDLWRRGGVAPPVLERLADADAFGSLGLTRRQALWTVRGLGPEPLPLFRGADEAGAEPEATLPAMHPGEEVVEDYAHLRLSLRAHPVSFLRGRLAARGVTPCGDLAQAKDGRRVKVAGLVLVRQRPGSAKGVIFATLEDETGVANVIVWPATFERFRRIVLGARLLYVEGVLQREGIVIHTVANRLEDLSHELGLLDAEPARGLVHRPRQDAWGSAAEERAAKAVEGGIARADEVRRPGPVALPDAPRTDPKRRFPKSRDFH